MTLADWLDAAWRIETRRTSAARYGACDRHLAAFPREEIAYEIDMALLARVAALLEGRPYTLFRRPHRGYRATAPHTPLIVALRNCLARLRAAGLGGNNPPA